MTSQDDDQLVPVFIPALGAILIHAEDQKGSPLSHDEVIDIRDKAACIMMEAADARKMDENRGYRDIDPDNCWHDWQHLRRELGRKPDIDPGPRFDLVQSSDPEYQQTIRDARASLDQFRSMLPADGSPRRNAMVKTEIREGDKKAFMWLMNARASGTNFMAQFFELPAELTHYQVDDVLEISAESLLDWMVNDDGVLHGGFSLRYHRATLAEGSAKNTTAILGCRSTPRRRRETSGMIELQRHRNTENKEGRTIVEGSVQVLLRSSSLA